MEKEGVIKYRLKHQNIPLDSKISIKEINAWRNIFVKLELIGQIKGRYDGYGFGNISQRINIANCGEINFCISGTQTGGIEHLSRKHYCIIHQASPEQNSIRSAGQTKPSSEALTHASVYQLNNNIQAVIHVHCPKIWHHYQELKLPYTAADIPYGTPEMAQEVNRLFNATSQQDSSVFCMLGHEDGIISYSDTIEKAACTLINLYAKAVAIEQNAN